MAKQKEKFLSKLRFLLVGAIVFALLSNPMGSFAGVQNQSEIMVEDLENTIAGLGIDFNIQGEAYSPMEVLLSKPNNKELLLETVSNAQGIAYISLYDYHLKDAGVYNISARHLENNEGFSETQSFLVYSGTVSLDSSVELSKNTAKTGETLEMTVELTDQYGNPISGHMLKAISSNSDLEIYSPEFSTDTDGEMKFYLSSDKNGIAELSIFDSSSNKTLNTHPKIAFTGGEEEFKELGGFSTSYSNVILADESGSIDSFRIEGLEDGVGVSEEVSVSVTAIDESGLTVSDYTGTIRFSSSDTGATLPNDYTFEAEDQGEHTFSLSFLFLSPGEQTLTATDIDQTLISAETSFTVGEDEEVDYDSDFVTDDYEREGDFTLLSPSSGSYSNDSLEIQGEAEYGYTAVTYINDVYVGYAVIDFDNSFTYTIDNIEDGDYEIYIEVGEVEIDEEDDTATITSLVETSEAETVSIDTTAPELVSASLESETLASGETVLITVLSESELEEASVLLNDAVTDLEETSTSGKYQALLVAPEEEGEYSMDISLMDQLGNTIQYRDELLLTVNSEASETDQEESTDEDSAEEDTETSDTESVGMITGLSATSAEESIILSWEAPEESTTIAYYRIYYGPSSDSLFAISDTFDSSTSWIITNLIGDEIYYFAVSTVDTEGNESEQSGTTLGVPIAVESAEEEIQLPEERPNIEEMNRFPERTPDSGAGTLGLVTMSLMGSGAYMRLRKKKKL